MQNDKHAYDEQYGEYICEFPYAGAYSESCRRSINAMSTEELEEAVAYCNESDNTDQCCHCKLYTFIPCRSYAICILISRRDKQHAEG